MPPDAVDDPGESPGVRLRPALNEEHGAVRLPPAPEPQIRSDAAQGSRLDQARAEFRVAWQARIEATREQAEDARRAEERFRSSWGWLLAGGAGFGAYFAGLAVLLSGNLLAALLYLLVGAVAGWVATVPLALISLSGEHYSRKRAERLERELRELERS